MMYGKGSTDDAIHGGKWCCLFTYPLGPKDATVYRICDGVREDCTTTMNA